jgi:hypothetical protein
MLRGERNGNVTVGDERGVGRRRYRVSTRKRERKRDEIIKRGG